MDPIVSHEMYFNAVPPKALGVFWTAAVSLAARSGEPPTVFCLFVKPRISHVDEDALPPVPDGMLEARLKFFELQPALPFDTRGQESMGDATSPARDDLASARTHDFGDSKLQGVQPPTSTGQDQVEGSTRRQLPQRAAGYIDVMEIPGNKSRVTITCQRELWPRVEPTWRLIEAELKYWLLPLEELVATDPNAAYRPWELIPDAMWDREAVRLWWQGLTNKEIARKIGVTEKTVANRFAELRRTHLKAIPKRRRR